MQKDNGTHASARLKEEVEEELKKKDPNPGLAKAAIFGSAIFNMAVVNGPCDSLKLEYRNGEDEKSV